MHRNIQASQNRPRLFIYKSVQILLFLVHLVLLQPKSKVPNTALMIQKAKDSKTLNLTTSGSFNSTGFFFQERNKKKRKRQRRLHPSSKGNPTLLNKVCWASNLRTGTWRLCIHALDFIWNQTCEYQNSCYFYLENSTSLASLIIHFPTIKIPMPYILVHVSLQSPLKLPQCYRKEEEHLNSCLTFNLLGIRS